MKPLLVIPIALSSVLLLGARTPDVSSAIGKTGKPAGLEANETHAAVSLLGQTRTNVSAWLWLKADLYLHNGVEMRPLTETERNRGVQAQTAASDGHEQLDKEQEVTVVPSTVEDYRGVFGNVERATTAYKDMQHHMHNDPLAALPLFRLMTWIDPQFITAWTTGATIIARKPDTRSTFEALSFLNDGLKANPNNVEVLMELGYLHLTRRGDLKTAAQYFDRAREAGRTNAHFLEPEERDSLEESYRWLGLCYRDLGERDLMKLVAEEGLGIFPDDLVLAHMIGEPMILTESGLRAWRAKLGGEPTLK